MSTMDSSRHLASLKEVSVWPNSSGWWKASNPVTSEYGVVTVLLSLPEIITSSFLWTGFHLSSFLRPVLVLVAAPTEEATSAAPAATVSTRGNLEEPAPALVTRGLTGGGVRGELGAGAVAGSRAEVRADTTQVTLALE